MADNKKRLEEMQRLLDEIGKVYSSLNEKSPFGKDAKNLENSTNQVKQLEDALIGVNQRVSIFNSSLNDAFTSFKGIVQEIKKSDNGVKSTVKAFNQFSDAARKVRDHQEGISILSVKQIQKEQEKLKSTTANLQANISLLEQQKAQIQEGKKYNELSNKEKSNLTSINEALQANRQVLVGTNTEYNLINSKLKEQEKSEKKIQKDLGITGGILKGISKIPILGDVFQADEAVQEMETHLRDGGNAVGALGKGFKNIGSQIIGSVLNPANMVLGAFTFILSTFKSLDSAAGDYAKSMNVTYGEALKVREEMSGIASASKDPALNAANLQKTLVEVGNSLGTNAQLNEKDLKTMTKLTNQAGFTADELMNIQKLSLANGKSLEDNTKEILGGAKEYARRNKIAVNEKTILKEVNNMSASLKLSLGGSGDAMARSAVQAKQFGINLKQAESIANSLLDFESSIESELSAELITGKSLNLEKARGLALSGDAAAAAAEILQQVGSSAEFGEMNVLQQQEIAKAMGMQKDELAASLIESEALAAMSAKEGESALQAYDRLKASGKTEKEIVGILGEKAAKNLEAQSNQSKFNASIEKLKDIFVQVGDVLMPIFDVLGTIAEVIIPVITTAFSGLGKILSGSFEDLSGWETVLGSIALIAIGIATTMKTIALINTLITFAKETQAKSTAMQSLGEKKSLVPLASRLSLMVAQAAAWVIMNPVASIVGLGLAAGAGALIYSQMKDGIIGPGGETIVSGPKGSIQVDKDDSMIVGTDLGGKKKSQKPAGDSGGSVNIDLGPTNALLQQLISAVNAGGSISIDGQKVGEALKLGTYKTQ